MLRLNFLLYCVPLLGSIAFAAPLQFAILADTQWPLLACETQGGDSTGVCVNGDSLSGYRNPHSVAVDFIHQIQEQLIQHHAPKFVVLLGDFGDEASEESIRVRATWAQELYDAGIGVFPVRGNHDEGPIVARKFIELFPQTKNGSMGMTPASAMLWTDSANVHPIRSPRAPFTMGSHFTSPACAQGRSYSFQEEGVSFVFLDQFMGTKAEYCYVKDQIPWMDSVLSARPPATPAFVFAHKPLIGACHEDVLMGDNPGLDSLSTTRFIESLVRNQVEILMTGHEHLLQHSLVEAPGLSNLRIQQAIFPGASWKLYPSLTPTMDEKFNVPAYGKKRETPLGQELGYVGYQMVTVDGPRVEIQSWGASTGILIGDLKIAPDLRNKWNIRRTWGWSPRGKKTLLAPNDSLKVLSDSSQGTRVRILSGVWKASNKDFSQRTFSALASTDWQRWGNLQSAVWTLWGLEKQNGSELTPKMAIAMSVDPEVSVEQFSNLCLLQLQGNSWQCAGTSTKRIGAWQASDPIGSFGVDPSTREAWAVVEKGGTYAVGQTGIAPIQAIKHYRKEFTLQGDLLLFPQELRGKEVRIEISNLNGQILDNGTTTLGSWKIKTNIHGVIQIRCILPNRSVVAVPLQIR